MPSCFGGGYDKKSSYEEWIRAFDGKVKKLILIGQTKMDIARACETCGFKDYVLADNMEEAVDICYHEAEEGECVLLSPACASIASKGVASAVEYIYFP